MDKAIKASEADRNAYRATLSAADLGKFDAMRERMVGGLENIRAHILELVASSRRCHQLHPKVCF